MRVTFIQYQIHTVKYSIVVKIYLRHSPKLCRCFRFLSKKGKPRSHCIYIQSACSISRTFLCVDCVRFVRDEFFDVVVVVIVVDSAKKICSIGIYWIATKLKHQQHNVRRKFSSIAVKLCRSWAKKETQCAKERSRTRKIMGKEVYGIVEELVCMCKCAQKNITKNNNIENVKYIVNKSDSILDDFGHISLHRGCWCRCCAFLISNFSLNAHISGRRYGGVRVFIRCHYLLFLYPILV